MKINELDDFRNVLYLVWKQVLGRDPTPIQYEIARLMQHGPKRLVLEAFRGVGKSWIASAYVVDELRKDPTQNILVVSASKARADDFSTFALRLIHEVPIFQHLIPTEGQRCAKIAFDVAPAPAAHAPSVKSIGITGQMTGSRADKIIADDVEIPGNSATQLERDKLKERIKEFDAILKPTQRARVLYLGTPQTEQSIYNELEGRGYTKRVFPVKFPTQEQRAMYGSSLDPTILSAVEKDETLVGKSTDPDRFNEMDLLEREASYGRTGFALQFMLDTRLSDMDRYPLKLSDLVVMDLDNDLAPEKVVWARSPELERRELTNVGFNGDRFYRPLFLEGKLVPYQGSVMAIDPSGRGKDETGVAVVKMLNSQLFVPLCVGMQGGYSESTLIAIAENAKAHKVNRIIVEANFGDGMFSELLKPVLGRIYPCTVEEVKHSVQKERRIIDTLEPVLSTHRLVMATRVIEQDSRPVPGLSPEQSLKYQLMYQLTRLTRDRGSLAHDDRLDALAIGVNYWTTQMARDIASAIKTRQEADHDKQLRDFMDAALGRKHKPGTWLSNGLGRFGR